MARKTVFVNEGSFTFPYYRFSGVGVEELSNLQLIRGNRYTFRRLDQTETHPFYITDSVTGGYPSKFLSRKLKGQGDVFDGIEGGEAFTLRIGKKFKRDRLYYVCTAHPQAMFHSFEVVDKPRQTRSERLVSEHEWQSADNPLLDAVVMSEL